MFSNHSDFCFHITIPKILDKKSLYGRKNFISEKKTITKNLEKNQLFSKSLLRSDGGGTFRLHFRNLQKFVGNNPSILAAYNSVSVAA